MNPNELRTPGDRCRDSERDIKKILDRDKTVLATQEIRIPGQVPLEQIIVVAVNEKEGKEEKNEEK